ncbi:hypothetical protein [Gallibacterium anatis]|uniref:hypothetical protein n=1 Tax=Gallibacterium anatis TaxID=750 RepID=UPI0030C996CD
MKKIILCFLGVISIFIAMPKINYYLLSDTYFFDNLDICEESDYSSLCPDSLSPEAEKIHIKFSVETNVLDVVFLVKKDISTYLKRIGVANEKGKQFFMGVRFPIVENIYCYKNKYDELYIGTQKLEGDKYIYDLTNVDKRYGNINSMCE